MKNYVQKGENLTLAAPHAVNSGDGALIGSIFGVASVKLANAETGAFVTEGVFDLPKATGAITAGAKVYWDNTAKNVTTTAASNTLIGVATQAAGSGDATARVKLGIVA